MKNLLLERLAKEMSNGLDFMEGKEKIDSIIGEQLTIVDFGFLTGDDGEFAVYTTKEYPTNFFFGGQVLSDRLKKIENLFTEDEIKELKEIGIPIKLSQKKSKESKRLYVAVDFLI